MQTFLTVVLSIPWKTNLYWPSLIEGNESFRCGRRKVYQEHSRCQMQILRLVGRTLLLQNYRHRQAAFSQCGNVPHRGLAALFKNKASSATRFFARHQISRFASHKVEYGFRKPQLFGAKCSRLRVVACRSFRNSLAIQQRPRNALRPL